MWCVLCICVCVCVSEGGGDTSTGSSRRVGMFADRTNLVVVHIQTKALRIGDKRGRHESQRETSNRARGRRREVVAHNLYPHHGETANEEWQYIVHGGGGCKNFRNRGLDQGQRGDVHVHEQTECQTTDMSVFQPNI